MSHGETRPGIDPETKIRRKAARAIAQALWRHDWRKAHPDAPQSELKKAWEAARAGEMKRARRALAALEREGYRVVEADD